MWKWKQTRRILIAGLFLFIGLPAVALAAQSASSNYQVNEVFFGSGGELNACSTNFCSKQSAGETAVGNTSSTNFQAQAGFNTDRTPYIEFDVDNVNVNLGTLTATTTKTTTATFSIKSYLSSGYVVTNASDPPSNGSYTIHTLTTPTAPSVGTEEFGINLVANTSPVTFGANPVQSPDSTFGFGTVTNDYDGANFFKYVKGDIVASSSSSTSTTTYTVSYLFNVSNVTPGGTYTFHHVLVATSTY